MPRPDTSLLDSQHTPRSRAFKRKTRTLVSPALVCTMRAGCRKPPCCIRVMRSCPRLRAHSVGVVHRVPISMRARRSIEIHAGQLLYNIRTLIKHSNKTRHALKDGGARDGRTVANRSDDTIHDLCHHGKTNKEISKPRQHSYHGCHPHSILKALCSYFSAAIT